MLISKNYNQLRKHQQGAVLIVSLIILLLLTIIGLSSSKTALMQTLMTANSQFVAKAAISAEQNLKIAEDDIESLADNPEFFSFESEEDHYYGATQLADANVDLREIDWENTGLFPVTGADGNDATKDKYVVEFIGKKAIPGQSISANSSTTDIKGGHIFTYRVTARSLTQKGAERVIQSIYVTNDEP